MGAGARRSIIGKEVNLKVTRNSKQGNLNSNERMEIMEFRMEGMELNGMDFSESMLDNLIESAKKKSEEDEKERKMKAFTNIIKGIARKYESKWVDREDLEQDLWVRILTLISDCGGIENVDENLVARIAFNKAVDIYRYCRRRYDSKAEFIEGSSSEYDDAPGPDYFDRIKQTFSKDSDVMMFKEVINLFPMGSKERKYVVMRLVNSGVLDIEYLDAQDILENLEIPEKDIEEYYIRCLGYKSHAPGSWIVKKRNIRAEILKYLND